MRLVCQGLNAEIVGPTIPDLMERLDVNYEQFSVALGSKGYGMLTGAVVGGFLHERFCRHIDLLVAIGLVLSAVATVATPFSGSIGMLAAIFVLSGFAEQIINAGMV